MGMATCPEVAFLRWRLFVCLVGVDKVRLVHLSSSRGKVLVVHPPGGTFRVAWRKLLHASIHRPWYLFMREVRFCR